MGTQHDMSTLCTSGVVPGIWNVSDATLICLEAFWFSFCIWIRYGIGQPIDAINLPQALTIYLLSASCKPEHTSQKYLFLWHSVSLAENWRRQDVMDEFISTSIDKSINASSRLVTYLVIRNDKKNKSLARFICTWQPSFLPFRKSSTGSHWRTRLQIIDVPKWQAGYHSYERNRLQN